MIEDYGVLTCVSPSCGWVFDQEFNGGVQRVPVVGTFNNAAELVFSVRLFRATHALPEGDVEREVANYIKIHSPQNDKWHGQRTTDELVPPGATNRKPPLIDRINEWLLLALGKKVKLEHRRDEISKRAAICLSCPQNIQWQTKCEPCNEAVIGRGRVLRQVITSEHDNLNGCRLHSMLLPAAIFIDRDHLPDRHPSAPTDCWIP